MQKDHELLWEIISRRRGRNNAIIRAMALAEYNSQGHWRNLPKVTDRELRKLKEELVMLHGKPIGSSEDGYFVIETPGELQEACEYLHKKALPMLEQEKILRETFLELSGTQPRLI